MCHDNFEKYADQKPMSGHVSKRYAQIFNQEINPIDKNTKVLDFGCGDGKYFNFFKKYFSADNIFGTEISQKRIDRCLSLGWQKIIKINPAEKLPFEDNFFDFINFDQVIEHIKLNEIDFYLSEFKRILKLGGKIILITPNYPIKRIYDWLNAIIKLDFKRIFDDPTHIAHYNFSRLKKKLSIFRSVNLLPTGGTFYKILPFNFFSHKIIGIIKK